MGWSVTEVRLLTNPDVTGLIDVAPPDRPNPAGSPGAYTQADNGLRSHNIIFDDVRSYMLAYSPPSSALTAAASEVCAECSKYMTGLVSGFDDVVVLPETVAYRIISDTEHDVYTWCYPRNSGTPVNWGFTMVQSAKTYKIYVLIVFRLTQG